MAGTPDEEPPPESGGPRRPRRRWPRRLLVATATVGGLALAFYAFLPALAEQGLEAWAARSFPGRLEIARVERIGLDRLVLHGVNWRSERSPLLGLERARIELDYSPRKLLGGDPRIEAIRIEAASVELTLEDLPHSEKPERERSGPPALPPIELALGEARVHLADATELRLAAPNASGKNDADGYQVAFSSERLSLWKDGDERMGAPLTIQFRYAPASIDHVELAFGDELAIDGGKLALAPEKKAFELPVRIGSGLVDLRGELAPGKLRASVRAEELPLETLPAELAVALPFARFVAGGRLSLEGEVELDPRDPWSAVARASLSVSELDTPRGRIDQLSTTARFESQRLFLSELDARAGGDRVVARDLEAPLQVESWREVLGQARGRIEVSSADIARWLGPLGEARETPVVLELEADLDGLGTVELQGRMDAAGGTLAIREGRATLARSAEPLERTELELALDLDFRDLATPARALGFEGVAGSLAGEVELAGPLAAPRGHVRVRGTDVRLAGLALDLIELEIFGDGSRVAIQRALAQGPSFSAVAHGAWLPSSKAFESLELLLETTAPRALHARLPDGRRIAARLEVAGPLAELGGSFSVEASELRLGLAVDELHAGGSFEARAGAQTLRIDRLELRTGEQVVSASGGAERGPQGITVDLERIAVEQEGAALGLAAPARLRIAPDGIELEGELALRDASGGSVVVAADPDRPQAVVATLASFDPDPLFALAELEPLALNSIDGSLRIDPSAPSIAGYLQLSGLSLGRGPSWSLELAGACERGSLLIQRLEGRSERGERVRAALAVPLPVERGVWFAPGDVQLDLECQGVPLEPLGPWIGPLLAGPGLGEETPEIAGVLSIEARCSGTWERLEGSVRLDAEDLELGLAPLSGFGPLGATLVATLGERIELESLECRGSDGARASLQGSVDAVADLTRFVAAPREMLEKPLTVSAELELPSLARFANSHPSVRRLEGSASGRGRIEGTLAAPRVSGRLEIRDGGLRLNSRSPSLEGISADLVAAEQRLEIDSQGAIGAAPFEIRGTIERFFEDPELDLILRGDGVPLVRTPEVKLRADMALALRGKWSGMQATGWLSLREGRFTHDFNLLRSVFSSKPVRQRKFLPPFFREPPWSRVEFDIAVQSSAPVVVDSNLVKAELRPELRLLGTGLNPLLSGPLYVDPSRVELPSGSLRLRSGLVRFRPEEPSVPELALSGEMRLQGHTIQAQVGGTWREPEIVLTADPPLPSDDLLHLFLTGRFPEGTEADQSLSAAQSVAVFVTRDTLGRLLRLEGDSEDLLDRLELEYGAEASRTGTPLVRAVYYLSSRPRGPGLAWYITAERDIYDKVNGGAGILFRFR